MSTRLWSLILWMAALGCAGPKQAINETVDEEGFPIRLELGADDEEPLDQEFVDAQMDAYRAQEAARVLDPAARAASGSFDPYEIRGCPPGGSSRNPAKQKRNELKNRRWGPEEDDVDPEVTLEALREPGYDRDRWSEQRAGVIEGYITDVFGTGPESCNCKTRDKRFTDTHIDVVANEGDRTRKVVVEVTPIWRIIHEEFGWEDWSSRAIKDKYEGRRVRITGWLYFDESHITGADNTDPENDDGERNWRATAWELHPVTGLELLD